MKVENEMVLLIIKLVMVMLFELYVGKFVCMVFRGESFCKGVDLFDSLGDFDMSKIVSLWFGVCIFLIVVVIILRLFFF